MKNRFIRNLAAVLVAACPLSTSQAAPAVHLAIQTDQPGAKISPTMWGIFFEDINFGADGGLYAELIKNRSFEFPDALMGWSKAEAGTGSGSLAPSSDRPLSAANPHYLRVSSGPAGKFTLRNEGFRGIGVRSGDEFNFSTWARPVKASPLQLRVALVDSNGTVLAETRLKIAGTTWSKNQATLRANGTALQAHFELTMEQPGAVDLDVVSLFPAHTWKHRPGGLRADMVQMLADLKPGFMRFPGGCIVEGKRLDTRYQWKATLGKPEDRRLIINRWNDEFKHRPTPDYFESFGLGFFEFFQLCEDIGTEPLPILNCGMACQFNSGELVPMDQLDPFIQDALDLIEFANGPVTSPWGRQRAQMGHPKPFNLKLLGVGNEQWGPAYIERYTRFAQALKKACPEVKLISSAGPGPADEHFRFAWPKLRELNADIVDEHCYARPDWFLNNSHRYDGYDRKGPKVFMGEYAAQSDKTVSPNNRNNWECALAEAAYMTGLERNADVVVMASYAPLFAHVDAWQWTPNLIWCDNLRIYGTPSYYVQQMFSRNRGDVLLPTHVSEAPSESGQPRLYATASRDARTGEVIVKVVNAEKTPTPVQLNLGGARHISSTGKSVLLTSADLEAVNSIEAPKTVAPRQQTIRGVGQQFEYTFPGYSFSVLRLGAK